MKGKPSEDCQIAMLQILAEHLMRILNPDAIADIATEYADSVSSPALRLILEAYRDGLAPPRVSDQVRTDSNEQGSKDFYDGPTTYALAFRLGLRVQGADIARRRREPKLHQGATQVLIAMVKANTPTMNEMLEDLVTRNIRIMTADHWITTLEALSTPERKGDLEEYTGWMIGAMPREWLKVFLYFFDKPSPGGHHPLVPIFTSSLADNLPHKLAQRRWLRAVERISILEPGQIVEFRRAVDVVWKRHHEPAFTKGPLVKSPLPSLLDRMTVNLGAITQPKNFSQLPMYTHILEVLVPGFVDANSVDQTFTLRFAAIRRELIRIQSLVQPVKQAEPIDVPGINLTTLSQLINQLSQPEAPVVASPVAPRPPRENPPLLAPLMRYISRVDPEPAAPDP